MASSSNEVNKDLAGPPTQAFAGLAITEAGASGGSEAGASAVAANTGRSVGVGTR